MMITDAMFQHMVRDLEAAPQGKEREHPIFLYLHSETHGAMGVIQGIQKYCSCYQIWYLDQSAI